MTLLLKNHRRKCPSKPLHKSFAQQATGISLFQWKPIDIAMASNFIGVLKLLHNTSPVSLTVTHLGDNASARVHPTPCPPPSEAREEIQTTHAVGHFPLQEPWCSLFLVEDYALPGSMVPLQGPQGFQELAESGPFS